MGGHPTGVDAGLNAALNLRQPGPRGLHVEQHDLSQRFPTASAYLVEAVEDDVVDRIAQSPDIGDPIPEPRPRPGRRLLDRSTRRGSNASISVGHIYRRLRVPDSDIFVLLQRTDGKRVSKERIPWDN